MMLVGTVLGPGSIFIMLAGGLSIAFGLSNGWSFLVNLVPISIFILICFYAKPKYQIQGSRAWTNLDLDLASQLQIHGFANLMIPLFSCLNSHRHKRIRI